MNIILLILGVILAFFLIFCLVLWLTLPDTIREMRDSLQNIADSQNQQTETLRDLTKAISKIAESIKEKNNKD